MTQKPAGYSVFCYRGRSRAGELAQPMYDLLINKTLAECIAFARQRGFTVHSMTEQLLKRAPGLGTAWTCTSVELGTSRKLARRYRLAEAGITYTPQRG